MNFGQKLPKDNQTSFKKSIGNNRTFGKKLQNIIEMLYFLKI